MCRSLPVRVFLRNDTEDAAPFVEAQANIIILVLTVAGLYAVGTSTTPQISVGAKLS